MKLAVRDSCDPKTTERDFLLHSDPKQANAEILAPQTNTSIVFVVNRFFGRGFSGILAVLEDLLRLDIASP